GARGARGTPPRRARLRAPRPRARTRRLRTRRAPARARSAPHRAPPRWLAPPRRDRGTVRNRRARSRAACERRRETAHRGAARGGGIRAEAFRRRTEGASSSSRSETETKPPAGRHAHCAAQKYSTNVQLGTAAGLDPSGALLCGNERQRRAEIAAVAMPAPLDYFALARRRLPA